jgi:hypothetical protein
MSIEAIQLMLARTLSSAVTLLAEYCSITSWRSVSMARAAAGVLSHSTMRWSLPRALSGSSVVTYGELQNIEHIGHSSEEVYTLSK